MTSRSPAMKRVCEAAVNHFAVNGYDGASLNEIAQMVGIKKASLYSHFDGKDALFLQVLEDAVAVESAFATESLAAAVNIAGPGAAYVEAIADRYQASVHLRYLLRTVYLPPAQLKDAIGIAYEGFLDTLRYGFSQHLQTTSFQSLSDTDRARYGTAYIGIVESLFVELTYAGREPMETRREALWQILLDSLSLRGSEQT
ncbi:TetR/AcrR family transcriptional regulator [Brucella pituitosa]|uniref:TetR/AcrR family transcriptional regulator n=1 Tax=Brucella pituitosa TaxID=571256 RepID=A0ABS3K550_9HYPH|nr:TetR/AcrR family transcriptional regulator [Brucella pituitosa]MBO1041178.1 TetR/AcrR family transcriptional regulator [Brucella pituitosa]